MTSSKKGSPRKKRRNWTGRGNKYTFKSKFEARISNQLDALNIDCNYESLTLEYTQVRKYNPDFKLVGPKGTIVVEAKGLFDAEDRRKHLDVRKQHPEHDIRFVFYADQKLRKGAKSKYSDWCNKNDFKYAIGLIPREWFEEIGLLDKEEIEEEVISDERHSEG